jgi:DNA-formamidopyrimidine glycosylase
MRLEGDATPEGPEVKRSADFLNKLLVGRCVTDVRVMGGRYKEKAPSGLAEFLGALAWSMYLDLTSYGRIEEVSCKGKFQYWNLRPGWSMWCTYGMSGQWSTRRDDKHCAVWLSWRGKHDGSDSGTVYFNDPRRFGTLKFVYDPDGAKTQKKLDSLGPDMLSDPPVTPELFGQRLNLKPRRTLAEALMDQRVVSGVGNYVKAESLYLSELSPHRTVASLSSQETERLCQQVTNVMQASYNTGGATISTYRNVDGTKGRAQARFAVYGNKVDPMGNPVTKEETRDGRTTWWVPAVQR